MAQWLKNKARAALLEDPGFVPSTHMEAHSSPGATTAPVPGDFMPSSGLHGHCMYMVHRLDVQLNTHTHVKQTAVPTILKCRTVSGPRPVLVVKLIKVLLSDRTSFILNIS